MSEATNTKAPASPLIRKLDEIARRHAELEESLNDAALLSNPQRLVSVSKEKGKLDPVVQRYRDYQKAREQADGLREMAGNKADPDMAELAIAELPEAEAAAGALLEGLKDEFVAAEDKAVDSFFIEIRAGTGGDEAALFAGDLFEMSKKDAGKTGRRVE